MSFDTAIAELTAALKENSELLKISNAGRDAAIDVAKAASAPKTAAAPKAKAEAAKVEPEQPKVDDYTGDEGFSRMKKVCSDYLAVADKDEQQARATTFKKALAKLEAAGLSAVTEKDRPTLVGWVQTLAAGENVEELSDEPSTSLLD